MDPKLLDGVFIDAAATSSLFSSFSFGIHFWPGSGCLRSGHCCDDHHRSTRHAGYYSGSDGDILEDDLFENLKGGLSDLLDDNSDRFFYLDGELVRLSCVSALNYARKVIGYVFNIFF